MQQKLIVAHCRTTFLPLTETFIENQIRNLDGFDSVVLTRQISDKFKNDTGGFDIFANKSRGLNWLFRKMSRREQDFFAGKIKEKNASLLHAHFGSDAWYFLPLKKAAGIPLAVSFYGYDAYQLPQRFFGAGRGIILKAVFREADLIIVPSEHMKDYLAGLGCEERKIEVLSWGVEPLHCNGSTERSLTPAPSPARYLASRDDARGEGRKSKVRRFIHIGRMVEKKGQIYLLEAFRKILDKGVDAELTIIGDGPLKKSLLGAIDKLGIYAKVKLIDKLSNGDVHKEIMSHNICVQPSVMSHNNDSEGVPTVIMEALACGLPVISTLHSGIPEIIKHGSSGLLVPERDPAQLADAMEKLAKNPDLCAELGRNGLAVVEERFDIKKQMRKLEMLYLKLIKNFYCHPEEYSTVGEDDEGSLAQKVLLRQNADTF